MNQILLYRNDLLPGSETFIAAQAVATQGYSPWFCGLKRVPGGLPLDHARVLSLTHGHRLQDKLLYRAYLRSGIAPRFYRRVRAVHPSLLHAHFAVDACAALPLQKHLQIPMVVTLHGYDVLCSDEAHSRTATGRVYLERRRELFEAADLFLCVSEHIRRRALERGFPARKLTVLRIGIELPEFESPPDAGPDAGWKQEPLILFAGRMVEKKGCIHLLRAMGRIEATMPQARLVLLGGGPLLDELENEAGNHCRNATFLGMRSPAEVRTWMRRARVLAAPSIVAADGDGEGLPTVLCEAQAMGLPVVAFDGEGVNEAVIADRTALLVPPREERALAEAILRLLTDHPLHHRLSSEGRKHAAECFDIRRQTALLEAHYGQVLSRSRQPKLHPSF
jgi:glycosyltransferase involved in cell wall biosynthesis